MKTSDIFRKGHAVFAPLDMKKFPFLRDGFFSKQKFKAHAQQRIRPETSFWNTKTKKVENHSPYYEVDFMGTFCMN